MAQVNPFTTLHGECGDANSTSCTEAEQVLQVHEVSARPRGIWKVAMLAAVTGLVAAAAAWIYHDPSGAAIDVTGLAQEIGAPSLKECYSRGYAAGFDAGFGGCDTYADGALNHDSCDKHNVAWVDMENNFFERRYAQDYCPQCGMCVELPPSTTEEELTTSAEEPTTTPVDRRRRQLKTTTLEDE